MICNDQWQMLVHGMLGAGLGAEDIALRVRHMGLRTTADQVRNEITILRNEGRLLEVLRLRALPETSGAAEIERPAGCNQHQSGPDTGDRERINHAS